MFFYIDISVKEALERSSTPIVEVTNALDLLAISQIEGKHIVCADREVLKYLRDCEFLEFKTRAVFDNLLESVSELFAYKKKLKKYILLTADITASIYGEVVEDKADKSTYYRVNIRVIDDTECISKTVLLCENITDAIFYERVTYIYQTEVLKSTIKLSYEPINGGGSTQADQYKHICNETKRLCVCITDSDQKCVNSSKGSTLLRVLDVDKAKVKKCQSEVYDLKVREIENLIATPFLVSINNKYPHNNTIAFLNNIESKNKWECRHHFDMKEGFKWEDILDTTKVEGKYWQDELYALGYLPKKSYEDKDVIIEGLGANILDVVINEYLSKKGNKDIANDIPKELKSEWFSIGELVTCWCCCLNKKIRRLSKA